MNAQIWFQDLDLHLSFSCSRPHSHSNPENADDDVKGRALLEPEVKLWRSPEKVADLPHSIILHFGIPQFSVLGHPSFSSSPSSQYHDLIHIRTFHGRIFVPLISHQVLSVVQLSICMKCCTNTSPTNEPEKFSTVICHRGGWLPRITCLPQSPDDAKIISRERLTVMRKG
jgi:hypothetical protein